MDAEGRVTFVADVGRLLRPGAVEHMREVVRKGEAYARVRGKKDRTSEEELLALEAEIGFGKVSIDGARERAATMKDLGEAERRHLEVLLVDLEVTDIIESFPRPKSREDAARIAGERGAKFAALWAAGKRPTAGVLVGQFFTEILEHASQVKDPDLFSKALEVMRERYASEPGAAEYFAAKDAELEAMRKAKAAGGDGAKDAKDARDAKEE